MARTHALHHGEKEVQRKRQTPEELARDIPTYIHTDMPRGHASFYAGLSYLPLSTLDGRGRPWVSILVTKGVGDVPVGIRVHAQGLEVTARMSRHDPFFRALDQGHAAAKATPALFAGVGVDFANRSRTKLAGSIRSADLHSDGTARLQLDSNEHLGNCPKYITVRNLVPYTRTARLTLDRFEGLTTPLPHACKDVIQRASTVFLATKHVPLGDEPATRGAYMGLNHRGGPPGFVRLYEEGRGGAHEPTGEQGEGSAQGSYLVLPDFSGNRFYQSLGNIQSSSLVGLAFPDFDRGHMLYITGAAENLFDEDAEALMPRTRLVTRIRITGAVFIEEALDLRLDSAEELSPYNPPIRFLRSELETQGRSGGVISPGDENNAATLTATRKWSSTVRTFSFALARPIEAPLPGGFGVFDFSELLNAGYSHMNEANPQAVNEDYLRTWTLSSAPEYDPDTRSFAPATTVDITVKCQPDGLTSSFLHREAARLHGGGHALEVGFRGAGGAFSCFRRERSGLVVPEKMLWVAGGVGITPFMSMWDALRAVGRSSGSEHPGLSTDIVLVFAGRDDDLQLLRHFLRARGVPPSIALRVVAYQSKGSRPSEASSSRDSLARDFPKAALTVYRQRLDFSDLARLDDLSEREAFVCGPAGLMDAAQEWLLSNGHDAHKVHQESYLF